jgi:hypothetical protein
MIRCRSRAGAETGLGAKLLSPQLAFSRNRKTGVALFLRKPAAINMVCRNQDLVYKASGIRHCSGLSHSDLRIDLVFSSRFPDTSSLSTGHNVSVNGQERDSIHR